MAKLTASPNPVGVGGPSGNATTTITWDTESNNPGQVYIAINGGPPTLFAGGAAGSRTGSAPQTVSFGNVYVFTLRRVSNGSLLATLTVTVFDFLEARSKEVLEALELRNRLDPPQVIYGLRAVPGPDTVDVAFHTNRPTIPLVQVLDEDRTVLASWCPLLGGLRTSHRGILGLSTPLPQGSALSLRITAAGRPDILGRARDRVLEAPFTTGTRLVEVLFDRIRVHNDGDPGLKGSGELSFSFVAADFASSDDLHAPDFDGSISSGEERRVDRSIVLPAGPRDVYVCIRGRESDFGIPAPGQGLNLVGTYGDRSLGSDGSEDAFGPEAWVARRFDVSERPPGFISEPFSMRTAPLGIEFTVDGRIVTIVRPGQGIFSLPIKPFQGFDAAVLGRAAAYGVTGPAGGRQSIVGRIDDGSLWHKPIDPSKPIPRAEGWERLAPDPGGAITAIQLDEARLEVVAVGRQGEPLRLQAGRWVELAGGRFIGALEVARDGRGGAHLAGLDVEGRVQLAGLEGGWRTVAEDVAGELQALAIGEAGLALLALDREGRVLHAGTRNGREIGRLEPLGGPRSVLLGARALDDGGLEVCVEDVAGDVHVLHWPDWPESMDRQQWERLGSRVDLDVPQPLPVPCPRRPIDEPDPCSGPPLPLAAGRGNLDGPG